MARKHGRGEDFLAHTQSPTPKPIPKTGVFRFDKMTSRDGFRLEIIFAKLEERWKTTKEDHTLSG